MPLSPGEKLGPYEILASIGKGGMGEVWRARDSRLGRDVAIKVSADQFSDRFEKEARSIAALNHSNICTLYDVGPNYLVMELIDGPTLADRILEGPIPLTEALPIARQIADALEAAHEKGIVHRDLKPGNVKIRPDGSVKVLDFGLAKSAFAETQVTSDSPTLMQMPTQMGVILGTAAYMPPEQARGKPVDKRADIWSFGVVLYEMLTGQRLFQGEDLTETLAAVVKTDPDLSVVPPQVKRLLTRCLQKDPKNRLRDIGDVWELLDDPLASAPTATSPSQPGSKLWMALAAALAIATAFASWAPWRSQKSADRPVLRLDLDLGADVALPPPTNGGTNVVISPDGTRLAYTSGSPVRLFLRRFDQPKAVELPGTLGASRPIFSPDGQWVGFLAGHQLNKISVDGGAAVTVTEVGAFNGWSWGEDGTIVFAEGPGRGLVLIPPGGGPPQVLLPLNSVTAYPVPQILPGGKAVLFVAAAANGNEANTIEVLSLADRRRKVVARGGHTARFVPSAGASAGDRGHLVYVKGATLFAVPFDLQKLEPRGTAVPVLDDVAFSQLGVGQFEFSAAPSGHGTLVYRKSDGTASFAVTLQWLDSSGKKEAMPARAAFLSSPTVSPDGRRIALEAIQRVGTSRDIWVYDTQRDSMTRLTFGKTFYYHPVWSPDGQYVVFATLNDGIFQARADGSGTLQALFLKAPYLAPGSFSPDGKRLAYINAYGGDYGIWTVPVEQQSGQLKAGKPEPFLVGNSSNDAEPSFSPDGHWLAYQSDESGTNEVYVRAFPAPSAGQGGKWQISTNGGTRPHWSGSGHELVYQLGDQLMTTSYTVKGETFVAEKPRVWVAKFGGTEWDLSPDGKRVALLAPADSPANSSSAPKQEHDIVLLQNFFDELRRKAPLGK